MKIRNRTGRDSYYFGLNIADGHTVEVPETLESSKKEFLSRHFDVVLDPAPEPVVTLPAPEVERTATPEPEIEDDGYFRPPRRNKPRRSMYRE